LSKAEQIIATNKLHINELREHFKDEESVKTIDISVFYREYEPDLKQTTINWRIYALAQMGILNRIGRGKFKAGEGKN